MGKIMLVRSAWIKQCCERWRKAILTGGECVHHSLVPVRIRLFLFIGSELMVSYTNLRSNVKGNLELLSAWLIDKGCCMPESRLVLQPTGNHYQTITTGT